MKSPKRPLPHRVSNLGARVVRGPIEGRWYWRVWQTKNGRGETVKSGWWHESEIDKILAALVTHGLDSPRVRSGVETVRDLMECWMADQAARVDLAQGTIHAQRAAARHLVRCLGEVQLELLDQAVLDGYRNRRLKEAVTVRRKKRLPGGKIIDEWEEVGTGRYSAPSSVRLELRVLRFAWAWGKTVSLSPQRDLPRVRLKVQGYVRNRRTPTPGEVVLVLRGVGGVGPPLALPLPRHGRAPGRDRRTPFREGRPSAARDDRGGQAGLAHDSTG